jgi:hypothetical protein
MLHTANEERSRKLAEEVTFTKENQNDIQHWIQKSYREMASKLLS